MKKTRISLYRGVEMTALTTDKFKFNTLSLSFIMPLTRENASYAGLAARVLNRGCAAYPPAIPRGTALPRRQPANRGGCARAVVP